jgi:hypothetical protein
VSTAPVPARPGNSSPDAGAQFPNVERWVCDYLLPTFPPPVGEFGATGQWRWCERWWAHDEAVTILTALWIGWEESAVSRNSMLGWLSHLYTFRPVLHGDDGPFRLCCPRGGDRSARHELPLAPPAEPAEPGWWGSP